MVNRSDLEAHLEHHGQAHVLQFWDDLTEAEKTALADDLYELDFPLIKKDFDSCLADLSGHKEKKDAMIKPIPDEFICTKAHEDTANINLWWNVGIEAISKGKIALLLMAGGMGTRLGVPYPKGMYNVGLPSGKTLYQLQAERVLRLQKLAGDKHGSVNGKIRWYIMTSDATGEATENYFKSNNYFGLEPCDVVLFPQNSFPCLTYDGKIMLETKGSLARSPDGNGGLYAAMKKHNITDDMAKHGVEYLFTYCVDNILVQVADPVFMGYCIQHGSECANKVVEKRDPLEPVGITCLYNGRYEVVEYSEISAETVKKQKEDGSLLFCNGNICNHFFSREFLEKIISEHLGDLPRHVAKKKIPCVGPNGEVIKPDSPNGIKLEKFVFDVFQFAKKFAVFEVKREDEFSPLKNAKVKDCPETCQSDLLALHARLVQAAGGVFIDKDGNVVNCENMRDLSCEISPLLSYHGEGLEDVVHGRKFLVGSCIHLTTSEIEDADGPTERKKLKNL